MVDKQKQKKTRKAKEGKRKKSYNLDSHRSGPYLYDTVGFSSI